MSIIFDSTKLAQYMHDLAALRSEYWHKADAKTKCTTILGNLNAQEACIKSKEDNDNFFITGLGNLNSSISRDNDANIVDIELQKEEIQAYINEIDQMLQQNQDLQDITDQLIKKVKEDKKKDLEKVVQ